MLAARVSGLLAHIITYQLAEVSWWEAACDTSWGRTTESRILRSEASTATDFQSDLGQMRPERFFCLYSATVKPHRGDQVYSKGAPFDGTAVCKLTGVTHLFFLN